MRRSRIEKIEQYARYLRQDIPSVDDDRNTLCQCTNLRAFGKNCEYLLPVENDTFEVTLNWEIHLRFFHQEYAQNYSDILCYTTLVCDSGRLCLYWWDICDGVQQCMFGYDEETCDLLECNECDDDEYRSMNGMCISRRIFSRW
ncbi:unnamed protein product [Rotaria socialis]|uniref:Uncharacterized protein n=1 Tax=Rotaria socialis TaxID=392032 RepID=A0A817TL89_9BILA|nr:unnamed protein product [Rotaria socialis]